MEAPKHGSNFADAFYFFDTKAKKKNTKTKPSYIHF